MRRHWPFWLIVMLALVPSPTRAAQETPPAAPLDLSKLLVDADEIVAAHHEERENLEEVATAASGPLDRATAELALANWWLAVSAARPATRWLLGLETPADRRAIVQAAEAAKGHRERALDILKEPPPGNAAAVGKADRRRLTDVADILAAFEAIYRAADLAENDQRRDAWWEASRGLAVTRETEDTGLAACALLWQAFAWDKAGRRERALDTLPEALTEPKRLPYDVISRLLRCRILADEGHYPAAVALTIRVAESSQNWPLPSRGARLSARRLAQVMEHHFLDRWIAQPATSTQPAAADRLKGILADVDKALGDVTSTEIYCLDPAIPILVKPPKLKASVETQPAAASEPAETTEPDSEPSDEQGDPTAPVEAVE